jgi:L-threonylcarbamoyladenylate synthase
MASSEQIDKAVSILSKGGIIIFPTDTVWGMGCRIDSSDSINRLYKIRRRPDSQASPVLVSSIEQAKEYYQKIPKEVEHLINKYWPGGLTVVYEAKTDKIPGLVRANKNTIGLRMPNHQNLLQLIGMSKVPLLGPSANFHNFPTPMKFSELDPELIRLVDYVLPGECLGNKASTVIDVCVKPWKIIRRGAVEVVSY